MRLIKLAYKWLSYYKCDAWGGEVCFKFTWRIVAAVSLLISGNARSLEWPSSHCGKIVDIMAENVNKKIIEALKMRVKLADAEYKFSEQKCDDGYFIFIEVIGTYKNPGFHWLVVVKNDGSFEIVNGM